MVSSSELRDLRNKARYSWHQSNNTQCFLAIKQATATRQQGVLHLSYTTSCVMGATWAVMNYLHMSHTPWLSAVDYCCQMLVLVNNFQPWLSAVGHNCQRCQVSVLVNSRKLGRSQCNDSCYLTETLCVVDII